MHGCINTWTEKVLLFLCIYIYQIFTYIYSKLYFLKILARIWSVFMHGLYFSFLYIWRFTFSRGWIKLSFIHSFIYSFIHSLCFKRLGIKNAHQPGRIFLWHISRMLYQNTFLNRSHISFKLPKPGEVKICPRGCDFISDNF